MPEMVGGPPAGDAGPVRVLAIDDDPALVRFLEIYLGGQGFEILSAHAGAEGIEQARVSAPDLILLDYSMPDMDGTEVLGRLKRDDATRGIPVVVLTARAELVDKVKSLGLGIEDYITKPFDIRELKARIDSILTRRREAAATSEEERLKTLRRVVASVSHEVNNPLAVILMCAETLESHHPGVPEVVARSRVIQDNVLRIRDIIQRLERVKVLAPKPYVAGEQLLDLETVVPVKKSS